MSLENRDGTLILLKFQSVAFVKIMVFDRDCQFHRQSNHAVLMSY